ncbi:MAG: hypothetical protein WC080_02730 [Patescibacteria group bacterium]
MKKVLVYVGLVLSIVAGLVLFASNDSKAAAEGPTCNFIPDNTNSLYGKTAQTILWLKHSQQPLTK